MKKIHTMRTSDDNNKDYYNKCAATEHLQKASHCLENGVERREKKWELDYKMRKKAEPAGQPENNDANGHPCGHKRTSEWNRPSTNDLPPEVHLHPQTCKERTLPAGASHAMAQKESIVCTTWARLGTGSPHLLNNAGVNCSVTTSLPGQPISCHSATTHNCLITWHPAHQERRK